MSSVATWDGPGFYHTKWSKSERERQMLYDNIHMWNLKYDASELIYKTETRLTDIENKLKASKGEKGGGGIN